MSEKPDLRRGPQKHWLVPLKGKWRVSRHLLIWPCVDETKGRVTAKTCHTMVVAHKSDGFTDISEETYSGQEGLERVLDAATAGRGTLTIWLPDGWEHFVLTGLAEQVDQGLITWRYLNMDIHRFLLRGQWRGRSIIVTSIAAWTGGTWDQWRAKTEARGYELFKESYKAIADLSYQLSLGSVAPTAGAAGLLAWRSWLGPCLRESQVDTGRGKGRADRPNKTYVAPIPSRPERARNAERHACYGLVCRHLRRGLVEGPIYCLDVSAAYLLYLCSTPLPIMYVDHLHRPSLEQLAECLADHTAVALVQVASMTDPYPCRIRGKSSWATGRFWTWLCGAELAAAVHSSHVVECQCAYAWSAASMSRERCAEILSLGERMKENGFPLRSGVA